MSTTVTPEGPGSVSGAPNLPAPLLLVHGWPENWYAWRLLMPELARDFEVIADDQRPTIAGASWMSSSSFARVG
jgi:pimeloyl-ACP methyl ester carboxylesterase